MITQVSFDHLRVPDCWCADSLSHWLLCGRCQTFVFWGSAEPTASKQWWISVDVSIQIHMDCVSVSDVDLALCVGVTWLGDDHHPSTGWQCVWWWWGGLFLPATLAFIRTPTGLATPMIDWQAATQINRIVYFEQIKQHRMIWLSTTDVLMAFNAICYPAVSDVLKHREILICKVLEWS